MFFFNLESVITNDEHYIIYWQYLAIVYKTLFEFFRAHDQIAQVK